MPFTKGFELPCFRIYDTVVLSINNYLHYSHLILYQIAMRDVADGRAVTRSSMKREVSGSNLGLVKSDAVLPTVRYRCDIS